MYAVVIGAGFGILYMVALRNAWSYFPSKKGMISGLIMSCYSVGAIIWVIITKQIANPDNIKPDIIIILEDKKEKFYSADSEIVKNVPLMLRTLGYIYLSFIVMAVALVNKRNTLPIVKKFSNITVHNNLGHVKSSR